MADQQIGALGSAYDTAGTMNKALGALGIILDPERSRDTEDRAYYAGMLTGPHYGGFAGDMGNAMKAQLEAQKQQDTLKAQYIPLILQTLQAQRSLEMQQPIYDRITQGMQGMDASQPGSMGQPDQQGQPGQPAPQAPARPGGMFGLDNNQTMGGLMTAVPMFKPFGEAILKNSERTPEMKNDAAAGITPAQRRAIATRFETRPNQGMGTIDGQGNVVIKSIGADPSNNMQYKVAPDGTVTAMPVPGATQAKSGMAGAVTGAEAGEKIITVEGPGGEKVPVRAGPAAVAGANQLGLTAPNPAVVKPNATDNSRYGGVDGAGPVPEALRAMQDELSRTTDPQIRAGIEREIARMSQQLPPGAPKLGQSTAAAETSKQSAKDIAEAYNELHNFATQSAPRNIGLLQTIEQLAGKTMIGPGSDKIQFVNGVLNTLGITPGADNAQNYQIMKKNLNMLVGSQRMGARGGGSDALQNLLEAANPNVDSMNAPSAKEAAQELIAYNRMMMDKDRLAPNPNSTSPEKYAQFETNFAPYADPRLWQMNFAADDKERKRLLSLIPESQRTEFLSKAKKAVNYKFFGGNTP